MVSTGKLSAFILRAIALFSSCRPSCLQAFLSSFLQTLKFSGSQHIVLYHGCVDIPVIGLSDGWFHIIIMLSADRETVQFLSKAHLSELTELPPKHNTRNKACCQIGYRHAYPYARLSIVLRKNKQTGNEK